jgi:hypothetical protein
VELKNDDVTTGERDLRALLRHMTPQLHPMSAGRLLS